MIHLVKNTKLVFCQMPYCLPYDNKQKQKHLFSFLLHSLLLNMMHSTIHTFGLSVTGFEICSNKLFCVVAYLCIVYGTHVLLTIFALLQWFWSLSVIFNFTVHRNQASLTD